MKGSTVALIAIFVILILGTIVVFKGITAKVNVGLGGGNSSFAPSTTEKNKWVGALKNVTGLIDSIFGGK